MTWYLDPETLNVYDHEGEIVGQADEPTIPTGVYDVMLSVREQDQPSAYNQTMLFDAAMENIEFGTPD